MLSAPQQPMISVPWPWPREGTGGASLNANAKLIMNDSIGQRALDYVYTGPYNISLPVSLPLAPLSKANLQEGSFIKDHLLAWKPGHSSTNECTQHLGF